MVKKLVKKLKSRSLDQRGAVLVIVAICLPIFLGMAALAIDVGSFYQAERQAQAAADAGALAGAADLPGTFSTAQSDATSYVSKNFPAATAVVTQPTGTTNEVQVTVSASTPSFFGHIFGVTSANVSASAVAAETAAFTPCSTPGNGCYAIFASDSNCGTTGSPNYGVTFNGSGDTITGGVHSNGSIDLIGGSQTLGPTTNGPTASNCTTKQGGGGDSFTSGPTPEAPIPSWPDDYTQILTACGGSGQVACTGPGGTPSYCTHAAANYTFSNGGTTDITNNVYCAYGTGTPSDPSTWNGLIYFQSGSLGTSSSPLYGTWIGGTIEVGHTSYLATQTTTPSYPVFYAAGSGNCSSASSGGVCMTASGSGVSGGIFAPNGTIEFNGNGSTANFLESKDVTLVGGGFTGDGPLDSGGGGSSPGTEALIQ